MEHTQDEYSKIGSILQQKVGKNVINYELIDIIGRGSCGAVYLAQLCQHPFTCYAVKTLPKSMIKKQGSESICNEVLLHRLVSWHPSIVTLEFVVETRDIIYVGLEYCEGGDLYDAITVSNLTNCSDEPSTDDIGKDIDIVNYNKAVVRDELIRKVFLEILYAVEFCHSKGVYHRDLKPENILLDDKGKIKLADFGLATSQIWSREYGCGSCFYMSPEAHKPKTDGQSSKSIPYFTAAADIWSLGIIFLNLCFGRNPWKRAVKEDPAFLEYILNPSLLSDMFQLSEEGNYIVKLMLNINPSRRINIKQVIDIIKKSSGFIKKPKLKKPIVSKNFPTAIPNTVKTFESKSKPQVKTEESKNEPALGQKEFTAFGDTNKALVANSIAKMKETITKATQYEDFEDDEGMIDPGSPMQTDYTSSTATKVNSNQSVIFNLDKLSVKKKNVLLNHSKDLTTINSDESAATFMSCVSSMDYNADKTNVKDIRQYASMAFYK